MIKRQFTLYLENKPGMLAQVARLLAKAKVNIEGISVAESTHTALVQLIVDNSENARSAMERAKIPFTCQQVAVLALDHKPGALADLASKLAKEKININFIYGTAIDDQNRCCLVISANDLKGINRIV